MKGVILKSMGVYFMFVWKTVFGRIHLLIFILIGTIHGNSRGINFELVPFADRHSVRLELTFETKSLDEYKFDILIAREDLSDTLVRIPDLKPDSISHDKSRLYFHLENLNSEAWEPQNPILYKLRFNVLTGNEIVGSTSVRIGFRSIESREGQIWLNGRPIFLRGIAINPPGRGIPEYVERSREFAEDYVRYMKSLNVNIIRIPDDQTWFDVCDELGMMVFGGNYGQKPPVNLKDAIHWYQEIKYRPLIHHPSLVIYGIQNEAPYQGEDGIWWRNFLKACYDKLKVWDTTRLYIGNAGYGYGQSGDICDLHRYWGWYYSSPFTFLNIRDNEKIIPFEKKVQPITFTECIGNYTGPDGRYNLTPDHKNPVSQLCWTGHAPQNLQAQLADQHQSFTLKTATELFRRLRVKNRELSGIFPFTILFYNWHTIENFIDMDPKPVCKQVKVSFQPILISWELWRTQVYSGDEIHPVAHIVNDDDKGRDLSNAMLHFTIEDETATPIYIDSVPIGDVRYYGTKEIPLSIQIPEAIVNGHYDLVGEIITDSGVVSRNKMRIYINNGLNKINEHSLGRELAVLNSMPKTLQAISQLGIKFREITSFRELEQHTFLVLDSHALHGLKETDITQLISYVKEGGRVVALKPDSSGMKKLSDLTSTSITSLVMDIDDASYPPPERPSVNGLNINPERPDHPVFRGIKREMLRVWSDYTNWNEAMEGMPAIYPVTNGFVLKDKNDVERSAILANYSVGLEGIALAEIFRGEGSVLISGFDLVNRSGLDPVADKLLTNLMVYAGLDTPHFKHIFIDHPILWGDYESEVGILTGIYSGLMLNTKPRLTGSYKEVELKVDDDGHMFAGRRGGWNNRAGIQYLPYGRRMFGPYYHRGFGGIPEPVFPDTRMGEGQFWCRVPSQKNRMTSLVWNPTDDILKFTAVINDSSSQVITLKPGEKSKSSLTFESDNDLLNVKFKGDRRLVILETVFH